MKNQNYDIILLDIRLPILNGVQVFEFINNYYTNINYKNKYTFINKKKPYIIALTAFCLHDDKEKYISIGFDSYISKPININQLNTELLHAQETLLSKSIL